MSERPVPLVGAATDTSFDQPGAGGYDLSARYTALKTAMRHAEWHGHLETSSLRRAVVPQHKPRWARRVRRRVQARIQPADT